MRIIKVQELLNVLKPYEGGLFHSYLCSPYFTIDPRVLQLYEYLLPRKDQSGAFERKNVHVVLFPGQRYNDKRIRYLLSNLSGHLENFLTLREFQSDEREYLLVSREVFSRRKADKAYSFASIRFDQMEKLESVSFHLGKYRAAELHHVYSSEKLSRVRQTDYISILHHLDHFYFLRKLQLQCELINLRNVFNAETEMLLMSEISSLVVKQKFFGSPLIEIYYNILLTLTLAERESEPAFRRVVELVEKHNTSFPVAELNNIYQYVKNYCIRMINRGRDSYRQTLFGIYKSILANKRLMEHDYFSPWEFKNIVTLGLRLREDIWVEEFIQRILKHLPPQERKNALTYNSAMLCFFRKNYRQTLKLLQAVEFTDLYYQLDARAILLKVYFETDDTETMLHHISAFKIFLRRNKFISAYQLEIYRNFIKYVLKIFRAGTSVRKLEELKNEILGQANISDRAWLVEMADEALI